MTESEPTKYPVSCMVCGQFIGRFATVAEVEADDDVEEIIEDTGCVSEVSALCTTCHVNPYRAETGY